MAKVRGTKKKIIRASARQSLGARQDLRARNRKAQRIAADLLVALKSVLEYMPSVTAFQRERIRLAEAAIAKAEGKE